MQLQMQRKLHKLLSMKASTALPLAILATLLSVHVSVSAAYSPTSLSPSASNGSSQDNVAQTHTPLVLDAQKPTMMMASAESEPATAAPAQVQQKAAPVDTDPPAASTAANATSESMATVAGPQPDTEAQAKARAILRSEEPAITPTPQPSTAGTVAAPPAKMPAATTPPAKMPAVQPEPMKPAPTAGMQPPALPISDAQQKQLQALLQQYRADQISAAEYHSRRAEILAGK